MSLRTSIAIGLGTLSLAVGALQALEPKTAAELDRQRRQDQVSQLSDAEEQARDRRREQAQAEAEADRRDRMRPGEHRPSEPRRRPTKVRLR